MAIVESVTANEMSYSSQFLILLILAIPIACISWTITHEELFREFQTWCAENSRSHPRLIVRKLYYTPTCEFCFSHYVTLVFLLITKFKLLFSNWRGYVISGFALVWIANIYMNLYGRIRLDIKREQIEISAIREEVNEPVGELEHELPVKPSLAQQKTMR
jgi:hypothetical protein